MIPFLCVMLFSLGTMRLGMTCAGNLPVLFTSASILTNPAQTPPYDNYSLYLVYQEADEVKVVRNKLDALAMQLQADPQYDAWILSYAGQRACSAEARHRAKTAKRYLVSKGISPRRIKTVDAGFHEEWGVELWMVIRNTPGPIPRPSIKPKDVKIIKCNKRSRNKDDNLKVCCMRRSRAQRLGAVGPDNASS